MKKCSLVERKKNSMELTIKLSEQETKELFKNNFVIVDNKYVITKDEDDYYTISKLVDRNWTIKLYEEKGWFI